MASAGTGGAINPNGNITKNEAESQVFTASPATGYAVNQWLVNSSVVQTGGNSYTLSNIQADQDIQVTFTATPVISLPTVTTTAVSSQTHNSATTGGNVTNDGGATVTEHGVVYGTAQNPTTSTGTKVVSGSGTGSFTSNLNGLSASTLYYIRAYAINSAGTAYGGQVNFTTAAAPAQTGSLQVTLAPAGAVSAGAQWQVDGDAFLDSGATFSGLSAGAHAVAFKTVSGWATPTNQTVTINAGQIASATGSYVIIPGEAAPEIDVRGNGVSIISGDTTPSTANHTDFGLVTANGSSSVTRTFTIKNTGAGTLNLTGNPRAQITAGNGFSVTTQPGASVAANGGSATFNVTFQPTAGMSGFFSATVSIANNDADENPYTFKVGGSAQEPDNTPEAFAFAAVTGAELSTNYLSNQITVSGINTAAAISITGGIYKINSGSYTSAAGMVNNGDKVTVQATSSSSNAATTAATLAIGGVSASYSVTTKQASSHVPSIFVVSYSSIEVYGFDLNGSRLPFSAFTSGTIAGTTNLTFDSQGQLYVGVNADSTVRKFSATGTSLGTLLPSAATPWDLKVSPADELHVLNTVAGQLNRYSLTGASLGTVVSGLSNPTSMTFGPNGDIYIVLENAGTVLRFSSAGASLDTFVSGLDHPARLAFDSQGRMFIPESINGGGVKVFSTSGVYLATLTSPYFDYPSAVAFDHLGRLYVANGQGSKIVRFPADLSQSEIFTDTGFNGHTGIAFVGGVQQTLTVSQVSNQTVVSGGIATFTVTVSGGAVPTYQWRVSTNGGSSWANIVNGAVYTGATTTTLTITSATADMNGYRYQVVATNNAGSVPSAASVLTVLTSFSTWQDEKFTPVELVDNSISGPIADPDGDDLTNLLEYALGLEPKEPNVTGLPEEGSTETDWTYTYARPADRDDLDYAVEVSTNLTSWTTEGVMHVRVTEGTIETWQGKVPLSTGSNVFFRLKVTQP